MHYVTDQPNLFKQTAYRAVVPGPLTVERRERRVVDRSVTVNAQRFDLDDLRDTLKAVRRGGVRVTPSCGYEALIEIGVLSSLGGREYAAREGENFAEFLALVETAHKEA